MDTSVTNRHLKQPVEADPITAALVSDDEERMLCLPIVAGNRCVQLEATIYDMLRSMSEDYDGGFWDYYLLSNGGFYMAPHTDRSFRFACENGFRGVLDPGTAGIVACAMAYSHLSFCDGGARFAEAYYLLCDYIYQHPQVALIRAALD